ncbi:MAG: carboxypeptidase regulatory-like domain-containing protein, partial [Bacteroidales bacterium]|nr:carboxypeptidase regulatory-like domain-containing protein [Bacteroidales bacterium]
SCGGEGTVLQIVDSVFVVGGETVIVDFILKEFPYPASNVLVEINHHNNLPFLTWNNRNFAFPDGYNNVRAGTRAFARYKVYRLLEGDELIPESWALLYDNVLEPFCYDTGWQSIDTGSYRYAVISAYSYNAAEPAFSNLIWKGLNVTVNIHAGMGGSPEGAVISFINQDHNPEHRYDALAPPDGSVSFTDVWPGIYDLNVFLDYHNPYSLTNISVFENITINITMGGCFRPPQGIYMNYSTGELCWFPPFMDYYTIYYEDFEDGVIPNGWNQECIDSTLVWTVETGSPSGFPDHAHSGEFNASFIGSSASTALITPVLNLQDAVLPKLSFWHAQVGDTIKDELKIYYKTSATGIWKPLSSYSYQPTWKKEWLNLPSPSANYYVGFLGVAKPGGLGICLDDINISTGNINGELPSNLEGYCLYLDGQLLLWTSDLCANPGELTIGQFYVLGIAAQYTGGSSIIVQFPYTYYTCDWFNPPENFTGSVNGMEVTLEWSLPAGIEPDEYDIIYDDGVMENAIAWNVVNSELAVRFTPVAYPCDLLEFIIHIWDGTWPAGQIFNYMRIIVYDDDGTYGMPGTELGQMLVIPQNYNWVTFDISSLGITITSGDFYLSHQQINVYPDVPPTAVDESSSGQGRSYNRVAGDSWMLETDHEQLAIRAKVFGAGYGDMILDPVSIPVPNKSLGDKVVSVNEPQVKQAYDKVTLGKGKFICNDGSQRFEFLGFNIWRNGIRLNNEPYTETQYVEVASPGGVYNYNITAYYDMGESCPLDPAFTVTVGQNFPTPQELGAQLIDDEIVSLTWKAPEGHSGKNYQDSRDPVLQGYNLWRNSKNVRYIPAPDTSVVDTVIFVGPTDYYVSALYDEGESWLEGPANIIVIGKGTLKGDVFDAIDYKPIEAATVTLNPGGYSAVTDLDGSYQNDEIPEGVYEVTFSANGYYPDSVYEVQIKYADSKQVNMSLFRETAKFLPFSEPWDDGSFAAQHWDFAPEQGKWHINQNAGHPYPAAEFTWEPGIANYSFALVSPFIISNDLSDTILLTFETKVFDYGSLGLETLSVEIWNGIYWSPIVLLENNTGTEWIKHTFNVSSYFRDSYMKVRFMVSGLEQYYLTTWQVDNVNVFIPTTANQEGDLIEDQQLRTTITEIKEEKLLVIYPNPASDRLTVSGLQQIEATSASIGSSILRYLSFYDLYGRRVNEVIIPPEQSVIHIDISDLPEGLYVLQLMLGNGKSVVKKVIIMR